MAAQTSEATRSRWFRFLEMGFCAAFAWVSCLVGADLIRGFAARPALLLLAPPIALLAVLAADFSSGFVHWVADTYLARDTPFVGPKFVAPFREHHEDPLAITRHDFIEANADNCGISLLGLVPAHVFLPTAHAAWATAAGLFVVLLAIGVLLTSVIHGWAHRADPPPAVRWLQRVGLVLSAEHHAVHHAAPHDRHYCITTGWLNPPLDRVRFFRRMEALLSRLGVHPSADSPRR